MSEMPDAASFAQIASDAPPLKVGSNAPPVIGEFAKRPVR